MNHESLKDYIFEGEHESKLPFICTIVLEDGTVSKGIVINYDRHSVSFYNLIHIMDEKTLYDFVELCLDWWWYSNKKIPLNLFYPKETEPYRSIIEHYPRKGVIDIKGHISSLSDVVNSSRPYKKTFTVAPDE